MQFHERPVEGVVDRYQPLIRLGGKSRSINRHLFGNFQMFLREVHGPLVIPQGRVGIS